MLLLLLLFFWCGVWRHRTVKLATAAGSNQHEAPFFCLHKRQITQKIFKPVISENEHEHFY